MNKSKASVIKALHVTEKAEVLQNLVNSESNPCVAKCKTAKYVFVVDYSANKYEIKSAVEEHFKDQNIHVLKVNTILLPPKKKKARGTRKYGLTARIKKAVVTLVEGERLDFKN
jgi:large subunit ribosomal protein L23